MEDEFGNVVTTFNGSVAAALANSSGADALQGTFSVAPLDGVASFTGLLLDKRGRPNAPVQQCGADAGRHESHQRVARRSDAARRDQRAAVERCARQAFALAVAAEDRSATW